MHAKVVSRPVDAHPIRSIAAHPRFAIAVSAVPDNVPTDPASWPWRHVHLDFHTAGEIPDVGASFDTDAFARAFRDARVGSVNLFAKCHHGWSYHPTMVGRMHPSLGFDLLGAQMEALQGVGIRTPVYVSALWDELSAHRHPGWRSVDPDHSRFVQHGDADETGWKHLDLASPYRDYLLRQIEEVVGRYPQAHGLWIDICFQRPSVSTHARDAMAELDLDPLDPDDRERFSERLTLEFFADVRRAAAGLPCFFNLGHVRRGRAEVLRAHFGHVEIESLPTAGWGYEHMPVSARYAEGIGMPYLGMTGKFHHLWGEMGGYKVPDALVHEAAAMLAHGARVCIGDHLHPGGSPDPSTYAGIGRAFAHVEAAEPFVAGSANVAEIAIMSEEAVRAPVFAGMPAQQNPVDDGCVRALLECRFLFDVVDPERDLSPHRLLILPDRIAVDAALEARVQAFLDGGGRLLVTGASGIDGERIAFAAGCEHAGRSPFAGGDYARPAADLRPDFVDGPLFLYAPSERLRAPEHASLGDVHDPFLDRGRGRFSGHLHAPARPEPNGYVLGAASGPIVRLAHPIFSIYHRVGAVAILRVIERVVERALGRARMLETSLPVAGRATLRRQEARGRDVLHLLHANPVRRGHLRTDHVEPIQDLATLRDVTVELEREAPVTAVRTAPEGEPIPFEVSHGRLRFTVPALRGQQMIEIAG